MGKTWGKHGENRGKTWKKGGEWLPHLMSAAKTVARQVISEKLCGMVQESEDGSFSNHGTHFFFTIKIMKLGWIGKPRGHLDSFEQEMLVDSKYTLPETIGLWQ